MAQIVSSAKDIIIRPISSSDARRICRKIHYSGKVVPNSQLHFGVFLDGRCEGVMQFGPSSDKRKIITLVGDTKWNDFIELNRMAFSDNLPRFSESRAISVAIKLIKKNYPNIKWIVSFADGCQCGDGTIYRASGFYLTGLKVNTGMRISPTGKVYSQLTFSAHRPNEMYKFKEYKKLEGFMLRYIYFIDKTCKDKLTVPIIPFSKIKDMGAEMYKGQKIKRGEHEDNASGFQLEESGSIPTATLQNTPEMEVSK